MSAHYRAWFPEPDILCCAQHVEVKILANKLYHRWASLIDKLADSVMSKEAFNAKKFDAISKNIDKTELELSNILRGLMKCCAPARHGWTNPFEKSLDNSRRVDNIEP